MSPTHGEESGPVGPFRLGDWTVEPDLNRLTRGETSAQLEPRLMDLLVFLAERPGEVLSHEAIIDGVWAEEYVGEGVLRRAVASLREALGDDARDPTYIETISKRGYRLIAEVAWPETEASAAVEPRAQGFRPRWTHALALAIAAVIALLVVLPPEGIWQRITNEERAEPEAPLRIVVLPFENLGPPEDEYFADGMTEELISRLVAVGDLHVISRTSAMHYKKTDKKLADISEELGVDYVLEGSVRWDRSEEVRDRVRITPQLIRVADDTLLLSEAYDRDIESILEVQAEIASQVVATLQVTLLEPERQALEARPTDNVDAYNAYLRGLEHSMSFVREERDRAIEMFERAVELDPEFELAHAWLSANYSQAYYQGDRSRDRMTRAEQAALQALEIDPNLAEGHLALGWYHDRCHDDYERALHEYGVALELRPNDATAISVVALALRRQSRWQEAIEKWQQVLALDPLNDLVLGVLAESYSCQRRHRLAAETVDRAIAVAPDRSRPYQYRWAVYHRWYGPSRQSRKVLEQAPRSVPGLESFWIGQEFGERNYRAALDRLANLPESATLSPGRPRAPRSRSSWQCHCFAALGEPERARAACGAALWELEAALAASPADGGELLLPSLAWSYAVLGRTQDAIATAERAVALRPVSKDAVGGPYAVMDLAAIYARVGEHDEALDRIEELLSIPSPLTVAILRSHPDWDPLRNHPRFAEILERYADGG